MAPPTLPVELTLRSRVRISKALMIVYFVQLKLAVLVVVFGYHVMKSMALFNDVVRDAYTDSYYPSVVVVCGIYTSFVNLGGIQVSTGATDWKRLFRGSHTWQVSMALFFYGSVVCVFFLLTVFIMTMRQQRPIHKAFLIGMKEAMSMYRSNGDIKEKIDTIQLQYHCCGAQRYSEWFRVSWVDSTFVNVMSVENQQKMEGGLLLTESVPFSCCDVMSPRPCIEVDVIDRWRHFSYDPSKDLTIYQVGCVDRLTDSLNRTAIQQLKVILLVLFIIMLVATVAYRYLQTSTDVALTSGDPTVAAPGYLYSGDQVKPTNPPATFDELHERMAALDELANMTDQEIAERVKELKEKKARKEKKLRDKEMKRQQRGMYKWLDEWSPAVPTGGVDADDTSANNANNINNAASLSQHLRRSSVTSDCRTGVPPPPECLQQYGRAQSNDYRAPPPLRMRSTDKADHRSRHQDDDSDNESLCDVESQHHRRHHDDVRHQHHSRRRHRSSSSSCVDKSRQRRHVRQHHSSTRNHSRRRGSRRSRRRHRD